MSRRNGGDPEAQRSVAELLAANGMQSNSGQRRRRRRGEAGAEATNAAFEPLQQDLERPAPPATPARPSDTAIDDPTDDQLPVRSPRNGRMRRPLGPQANTTALPRAGGSTDRLPRLTPSTPTSWAGGQPPAGLGPAMTAQSSAQPSALPPAQPPLRPAEAMPGEWDPDEAGYAEESPDGRDQVDEIHHEFEDTENDGATRQLRPQPGVRADAGHRAESWGSDWDSRGSDWDSRDSGWDHPPGATQTIGRDEEELEQEGSRDEGSGDGAVKGWAVMILQVIAGIIGGAALWLVSQWLWHEIPIVALIVALAVITGLVWVVRVVRRAEDLQTTIMAVLAGLFITVSPAALLLVGA